MTIARTPRPARWTADTEIAFLLALRLTGSPVAACKAIGRSPQGTYKRRTRFPAFAAQWDKVADEIARARTPDPTERPSLVAHRTRADGWTPWKRRAFLQALAESGRYDQACRAVRISVPAATKLRQREPDFDRACNEAIASALPAMRHVLESAAMARALDGVEEPVFRLGQQVGTRRVYSDSMLRLLLKRFDQRTGADLTPQEREARAWEAARMAGGGFYTEASQEETDRALFASIEKTGRKLFGKDWSIERAEAEADAAEQAARRPALPPPEGSE